MTDNSQEIQYVEKNILEIFNTAHFSKLKHRWDGGFNLDIKAEVPEPSKIPELERIIHHVLRPSCHYYKSVKRLYGKTYLFKIGMKPSARKAIEP